MNATNMLMGLFLYLRVRRFANAGVLPCCNVTGRVNDAAGSSGKDTNFNGLFSVKMSLGPFTSRCVGAQKNHSDAGYDDDNQGYNECQTPRGPGTIPTSPERVEDGGHDEIGDAATSVTPAAGQCVGRAHHVLVEEARAPD